MMADGMCPFTSHGELGNQSNADDPVSAPLDLIRRWLAVSQSDKSDKRLPRGQQLATLKRVNQSSESTLKKWGIT